MNNIMVLHEVRLCILIYLHHLILKKIFIFGFVQQRDQCALCRIMIHLRILVEALRLSASDKLQSNRSWKSKSNVTQHFSFMNKISFWNFLKLETIRKIYEKNFKIKRIQENTFEAHLR